MANLGFFEINTKGEYKKLSELTNLTFTTGVKYNMQIGNVNNATFLCVSASLPTKGGFLIKQNEKFSYTPKDNEDLYICTSKYDSCTINIAN